MELPEILYEDDFVFVFNKPAGLLVHPDGRTKEVTLSDMLAKRYPELVAVGEPQKVKSDTDESDDIDVTPSDIALIARPGIVHRLDADTTGVLIVAKTQESFLHLKQQFLDHTVTKVYHAFVYGHPKKEFGTIEAAIGRSGKDFRAYSAQRGARGEKKDAITMFRVLNRFMDEDLGDEWKRFSFMELRPKTGRTHQLRVHMKYMHHPIVSDPLYAKEAPQELGFTRTALHARSIRFTTPDGVVQTVEAPYPTDFAQALRTYKIHDNV
jgi:23S rRNA pseudouridine1911/1915/1917 synthase